MDFPTISDNKPTARVEEQLKALDLTIGTAEEMLHDADVSITAAIEKRGKLAEQIQHLWIRRHHLNQDFQEICERVNRNDPFQFPR